MDIFSTRRRELWAKPGFSRRRIRRPESQANASGSAGLDYAPKPILRWLRLSTSFRWQSHVERLRLLQRPR